MVKNIINPLWRLLRDTHSHHYGQNLFWALSLFSLGSFLEAFPPLTRTRSWNLWAVISLCALLIKKYLIRLFRKHIWQVFKIGLPTCEFNHPFLSIVCIFDLLFLLMRVLTIKNRFWVMGSSFLGAIEVYFLNLFFLISMFIDAHQSSIFLMNWHIIFIFATVVLIFITVVIYWFSV